MKYAIFTFEGYGFSVAKHLIDEGHEVLMGQVEEYRKTLAGSEEKNVGIENEEEKKYRLKRYINIVDRMSADTLVEQLKKVKNPQDYFIFFDNNNLFYYAQQLAGRGFHGNFPTQQDRLLETDRNSAKNFVKKYYPKLKITDNKEFRSIKNATRFLEQSNDVWVLKIQSDALATFVPTTNDPSIAKKQIIETLRMFAKEYEHSGFLLEVKIPQIMEYIPEKIYYDGVPLFTTVMVEHKYIGSGNIGFQVGCGGDVVFPVSMTSKIHNLAFPPIVDKMAKKHRGMFIWDALLMINPQTNDVYFGEFCSNRPGYNSMYTEFAQAKSVDHFFQSLVKHQSPFAKKSVGASVTLFNLLRDSQSGNIIGDIPIEYSKENAKNIWAYDIYKRSPNDVTRTVGYDYHLSPVTATGTSFQETVTKLYQHVEGFHMGSVYYRPKFDFLSKDYPTSIVNRLEYGVKNKLFDLPFDMK